MKQNNDHLAKGTVGVFIQAQIWKLSEPTTRQRQVSSFRRVEPSSETQSRLLRVEFDDESLSQDDKFPELSDRNTWIEQSSTSR
jgi:hypothetical protein